MNRMDSKETPVCYYLSEVLKPCPFRVHGERTASLTVAGEFYYNETFMPCIGEECPAFWPGDNICTNYGAHYDMNREAGEDE